MTMFREIRAENMKLRRSAVWPVFFLLPLLSAVYGTFNYMQNLEILRHGWFDLWTQHTLFYALFFFAPMIAVYCAYLWRLEHLGHNWNLVMTAPVPRFRVYLAKCLAAARLAALTQVWVFALYVLMGKLCAGLPGCPPREIALWLARSLPGAFAVIALQSLLSMCIRSFAVPVLTALGGGILGMLFVARNGGYFWPYALVILGMNANRRENMMGSGLPTYLAACAICILLFCAAAKLLLERRDVRA